MDILLAAMAFAVLMIVFSTAVTSVTEAYLRVFAIRADVLAKSALQFLKDDPTIQNTIKGWFDTLDDEHLKPALQQIIDKAEDYAEASGLVPTPEEIDAFKAKIDALNETLNEIKDNKATDDEAKMAARLQAYKALDDDVKSALARQAESLAADLRAEAREILVRNPAITEATGRMGRFLARLRKATQGSSADRVDTLSTYSFLQRLATSEIGKKIANSAEEYTLRGLTMAFERYVAASNEVFRKRAQAMTMVISIILAFVLNIDTFRLYNYLLNNPSVREKLVADIDRVAAENRATIKAYELALEQQQKAVAGSLGDTPGSDTEAPPLVTIDPVTEDAQVDPEVTPEVPAGTEDTDTDTGTDTSTDTGADTGTENETQQNDGGSGGTNVAGGDNSSSPSKGRGGGQGEEQPLPEELQKAIEGVSTARRQIEALSTIGNLPIGWGHFPNPQYLCIIPDPVLDGYSSIRNGLRGWWQGLDPQDSTAADKPKPENARNDFAAPGKGNDTGSDGGTDADTGTDASAGKIGKVTPCADASFPKFLLWFLNVLLAGFLIGLGGPFWYKVFTSLSHIVSVLRTFRGQPRQEAIGKSASDQQRASQPMVHAVEKIDEHTGPQLVNLFRAAAGLPAKVFPAPVTADTPKENG